MGADKASKGKGKGLWNYLRSDPSVSVSKVHDGAGGEHSETEKMKKGDPAPQDKNKRTTKQEFESFHLPPIFSHKGQFDQLEPGKRVQVPSADSAPFSFVWSIEYDVRFSGNWSRLLDTYRTDAQGSRVDLLASQVNTRPPRPGFVWALGWRITFARPDDRVGAYMPISRYSAPMLDWLHAAYSHGRTGYTEVAQSSLCHITPNCVLANFSTRVFTGRLQFMPTIHPSVYERLETLLPERLFHPVKAWEPTNAKTMDRIYSRGLPKKKDEKNVVTENPNQTNRKVVQPMKANCFPGIETFVRKEEEHALTTATEYVRATNPSLIMNTESILMHSPSPSGAAESEGQRAGQGGEAGEVNASMIEEGLHLLHYIQYSEMKHGIQLNMSESHLRPMKQGELTLKVNSIVKAAVQGSQKYLPGKITKVHAGGTYDVDIRSHVRCNPKADVLN